MNSNKTTDNFWEVWRTFQWPDDLEPEYRLYYSDDGKPIIYTMESLPGNYITVSQEIYVSSPYDVRVKDGKIEFLKKTKPAHKLVPDLTDGVDCYVRDVCIVTNQGQTRKWRLQTHEIS
jgi:hypothetical protein